MRMRKSTPRLGDDAGRARAQHNPIAPRHERRYSPQMGGCPSAAGGLATYPVVRRADPRAGRACARATQGARASLPPVPRARRPPAGCGTGGRTDCKPMTREFSARMKRIGSHPIGASSIRRPHRLRALRSGQAQAA